MATRQEPNAIHGSPSSAVSVWSREAVQSAAREGPPELHGGGGREAVRSTQEHGARLAEDRAPADRSAATRSSSWGGSSRAFSMRAAERRRQRCRPGELYCFRCRAPRASAAQHGRLSADHGEFGQSEGYLCGLRHPHVPPGLIRKLATAAGDLQVALPQAQQRIVEGADPSVNCDLEREPDAQPGK